MSEENEELSDVVLMSSEGIPRTLQVASLRLGSMIIPQYDVLVVSKQDVHRYLRARCVTVY